MDTTAVELAPTRRRFTVTGVVQGVGFRPFVHRLAHELHLGGLVGNDSAAVFIEVQGAAPAIDEFVRRLRDEAPPLAAIADVGWADVPPEPAREGGGPSAFPWRGGETTALARVEEYLFETDAVATYFDTRNGMLGLPYGLYQ